MPEGISNGYKLQTQVSHARKRSLGNQIQYKPHILSTYEFSVGVRRYYRPPPEGYHCRLIKPTITQLLPKIHPNFQAQVHNTHAPAARPSVNSFLFSPSARSFFRFPPPIYNHSLQLPLRHHVQKVLYEQVSAQNQVKASVQRRIRQSIAEEYPGLEPVLDDLLPNKAPLIVTKCQSHLNLVVVNNVPLFFNIRDGPYMPTLSLLHQYPNVMKKLQVDRGAIKFVLAGANIMCPGLASLGGALDGAVESDTPAVNFFCNLIHRLEFFIDDTVMVRNMLLPLASLRCQQRK
ncbi:uncharacterized protein LOC111437848 [Cucurbita moschata]|uniref:Uncharacterized protein LOC111437848 n=1 Tax=Cucurbita moschata TaxID=3662 RepID=A0A6J1F069_CUCMO|nr:uncharacterized protein LOC111437848 [Cucurbita moschata]